MGCVHSREVQAPNVPNSHQVSTGQGKAGASSPSSPPGLPSAMKKIRSQERTPEGQTKPQDKRAVVRTATADDSPARTTASSSDSNSAIGPGMFIHQTKAHLSERYIRERKLGSGAYGEVLLCKDKQTGAERAVKIIKKSMVSPQEGTSLLEEVAVVKQLDHPNIMKLFEFLEDKKHYYMVSEPYSGGELFEEIINRQRFTEVDAACIMRQVLSGVWYLHKNSIVHRDLKPENLLFESKAKDALIKIVDFGLSSTFDPKKKMRDRLGTPYYIAPEVLKLKYNEKCDEWSCGVILYILLCGYPPFGGNTDKEILYRVGRGKFSFEPPEWDNVSSEAKDFIAKLLTLEPDKRMSAEAALQHPWLVKMAGKQEVVKMPVLLKALGNMKKFHASQKLARAAFLFMGSKLTTSDETKELTQIFRSLDSNGDGQLDRQELIEGYKQLVKCKGEDYEDLGPEQIEEEVGKILDCVDFDKNGYIEYSEFVTVAMDKKTLLSRARLQAAFSMFDQDGSGSIAASELRRIMNDVSDEQWSEIIREVDSNNDGEVDFEEFVAMMQKLH